jgi:hypothetical protein
VKSIDLSAPFDPLLQEAAFLDIGDVHIFEADIAAVVRAQDVDQLAHVTHSRPKVPPT